MSLQEHQEKMEKHIKKLIRASALSDYICGKVGYGYGEVNWKKLENGKIDIQCRRDEK